MSLSVESVAGRRISTNLTKVKEKVGLSARSDDATISAALEAAKSSEAMLKRMYAKFQKMLNCMVNLGNEFKDGSNTVVEGMELGAFPLLNQAEEYRNVYEKLGSEITPTMVYLSTLHISLRFGVNRSIILHTRILVFCSF